MFKKSYLLFIVRRTSFEVLIPSATTGGLNSKSYKYSQDNLIEAFKDIKKTTKISTVRILLKNDTYYSLEYSPSKSNEEIILDAHKRIPEEFTAQETRISDTPQTHKKLITVPVMDVWRAILKPLCASEMKIELFCAENESQEYGKTSEDGIATMKAQPVDGLCSAETVKIMENVEQSPSDTVQPLAQKTPQKKKSQIIYPLIVILIILIALVSYLLFAQSTDKNTTQLTPTPSIPFTPTPTTTRVDLSTIKVQVLNATGQSGVAGEVASLLSRAGFNTVDTGNAPRSEKGMNSIAIREASTAAVLIPQVQGILQGYEFDNIGTQLEDENYDLQVIIGK